MAERQGHIDTGCSVVARDRRGYGLVDHLSNEHAAARERKTRLARIADAMGGGTWAVSAGHNPNRRLGHLLCPERNEPPAAGPELVIAVILSNLNDGRRLVRIQCRYCKRLHNYFPDDLIQIFAMSM
ncbi:hypothetical protein NKI36_14865 [Mesorhizobium caraganae]|uniref:Uncharacterized protein n=1 Tax=Mesorhizobium caraganae TaxID=483206 RepID=A0ABV1Z0H3_9HYPH